MLHASPRVLMDWISLLLKGLPSASADAAIRLTRIPQSDLARALNIPERTLARRKRARTHGAGRPLARELRADPGATA